MFLRISWMFAFLFPIIRFLLIFIFLVYSDTITTITHKTIEQQKTKQNNQQTNSKKQTIKRISEFSELNLIYQKTNKSLLFTYDQYSCIRCSVTINRILKKLENESIFSEFKIDIYHGEQNDWGKNAPKIDSDGNRISLVLNGVSYILDKCQDLYLSRPEIEINIVNLLKCVKKETGQKLNHFPKELINFEEVEKLLQIEDYLILYFGEDVKFKEWFFNLDLKLEITFGYTSNSEIIDKITLKYRGSKFGNGDYFCVLRKDELVDKNDPYQLECMTLKNKTKLIDMRIFYLTEKWPKIRDHKRPDEIVRLVELGKTAVIYVKNPIFDSKEFENFRKLIANFDKTVIWAVYPLGSEEIRHLKYMLKKEEYKFNGENLYQIYPGEVNGVSIVKMRNELTRWNLKSFLSEKKSDKLYDKVQKITENVGKKKKSCSIYIYFFFYFVFVLIDQ